MVTIEAINYSNVTFINFQSILLSGLAPYFAHVATLNKFKQLRTEFAHEEIRQRQLYIRTKNANVSLRTIKNGSRKQNDRAARVRDDKLFNLRLLISYIALYIVTCICHILY